MLYIVLIVLNAFLGECPNQIMKFWGCLPKKYLKYSLISFI